MATVVFCSAKGAPGVTTSALLTAALWPRAVLVLDADAAGGDVALRLPRPDGSTLDPERGLLSLFPHARKALAPSVLHDHAQSVVGGLRIVAGVTGPEQALAAGPLWVALAKAVADLPDADVVVDAGRVHSQSVQLPLLRAADAVVVVMRPSVAGVVHTREHLRTLLPVLTDSGRTPRLGLVVVAEPGREADAGDAVAGVVGGLRGVEYFGQLAHDPRGAGIFEGRPVSRPHRTMLLRSAAPVVSTLATVVGPRFVASPPTGPVMAAGADPAAWAGATASVTDGAQG